MAGEYREPVITGLKKLAVESVTLTKVNSKNLL